MCIHLTSFNLKQKPTWLSPLHRQFEKMAKYHKANGLVQSLSKRSAWINMNKGSEKSSDAKSRTFAIATALIRLAFGVLLC